MRSIANHRSLLLAALASIATLCVACSEAHGPTNTRRNVGGSTTGGAGWGGDAGGSGAACMLATQPKARVVVDCATQVLLTDAGDGYHPPPPLGSNCNGAAAYALDLASCELSWWQCAANATGLWLNETGKRKLSDTEMQSALDGLHMVTVMSGSAGCGSDMSTLEIEVTAAGATQSYSDSFYSCRMTPGAVYVDNIDAAFTALQMFSHP
ncbi:MAG: hypothetical protein ACHQ53_08680 [Polyangiales bacterium]